MKINYSTLMPKTVFKLNYTLSWRRK